MLFCGHSKCYKLGRDLMLVFFFRSMSQCSLYFTCIMTNVGLCTLIVCVFQVQVRPLLPQAKSKDAGKICVVIDLDETLVHSSFKVRPGTYCCTIYSSNII